MNRKNLQEHDIKTPYDSAASRCLGSIGTWYFIVIALIGGLVVTAAMFPIACYSQSLDDAVNRELTITDVNGQDKACGVLLGDDPIDVLMGPLQDLCGRTTDVSGSSGVSGGGAATPIALPSIVKKRLEEKRDEEKSEEASLMLASASSTSGSTDASVKFGKVLGLFISGEYESLDRDETTFADGYNSSIGRLIVGADVQITERILAGLAFDTSKQNGDFHGSAGDFEIKSYGILAFGSFLPFDEAFVQVYGGYTSKSSDRERFALFTDEDDNVTLGRPDSDFDTDQYSAGILIGYDFPVRGFTISPHAGLDWIKSDFDSYREKGDSGLELRFDDDDVESLQSTVGLTGSAAYSTDFGVVVPQTSIFWKYEFDNDSRDIDVSFVDDTRSKQFSFETDAPDRDFFEFNAGLSLVLPHGVQTFMNFRALLGHRFYDSYAGTMGLRIQI